MHDALVPHTPPVAGVILAGGGSTRLSGKKQGLSPGGGDRIIDRIFRVFHRVFCKRVRVTNDPLRYLPWDGKIVASDICNIRRSLTGFTPAFSAAGAAMRQSLFQHRHAGRPGSGRSDASAVEPIYGAGARRS